MADGLTPGHWGRICALLVACVAAALLLPCARPALADSTRADSNYFLTVVARQCSAYTDIMANRARNNLQESLKDLGKDTVYKAGQPVDPDIEATNDNCTPLPDWQFQLGTGSIGPTAATDHLSVVSNPGRILTVLPSTPLLNSQGVATGRQLETAVTVQLTSSELTYAQRSGLWIQGGIASDPLLNGRFQGKYAFGALRCAIDDLNGDNVEWIGYPSGYRHVLCYYYAVTPAPGAATIVVRKQLPPGVTADAPFNFGGNVSYYPGGVFSISAGDSMSFVRAAGSPWNFTETVPAGWVATVTCAPPARGTFTINGVTVTTTLEEGDVLTCTYVDEPAPPAGLTVTKVTTNGFGGPFGFHVATPDGGEDAFSLSTSAADQPVSQAVPTPVTGEYTITETLPAPTEAGTWQFVSARCNQQDGSRTPRTTIPSITVTLNAFDTVQCIFVNNFIPNGQITITKTTRNARGSAVFVVTVLSRPLPDRYYAVQATTPGPDQKVTAVPLPPSPPLTGLPFGTYHIEELLPPDTPEGSWRGMSPQCNTSTAVPSGTLVGVDVTLTAAQPSVTCDFVNQFDLVGTLQVTKNVVDPRQLRTGPVDIALSCLDPDGNLTTGKLEAPTGGGTTFSLPTPIVFRNQNTCSVTETTNGAGAGVPVTTASTVTVNGKVTSTDRGQHHGIPIRSGDTVGVTITDAYGVPLPPQTGAKRGPSGPPAPWALVLGAMLLLGSILSFRPWMRR